MTEIIAIISRKGGTGKTTSAQAIGSGLQHMGYSVLLVDLDAQRNLSAAMGAKTTGYNVTHLFERSAPAAKIVHHTPNGDIITGSPFLAGADMALTNDRELKKAIAPLLPLYDYIIIDTPANYGKLTRNALTAATSAIITAQAATFSQQGLKEIAGVVEQIQTTNKGLQLRGIIVTNYLGRSNRVKRILDEMRTAAQEIGTEIIGEPIRATDKVIEAQGERINLIEYAPKSTAAQGYLKICDVICSWNDGI